MIQLFPSSDVKTEFFSQPIIDLPKPVFTDNRKVLNYLKLQMNAA